MICKKNKVKNKIPTNGAQLRGCSASGKVVMRKSTGLVTRRLVTSSMAKVRSALCTALLLLNQ